MGNIVLQNIRKYYPRTKVQALDGVTIEFKPGTLHAILGENGAGKSTLMHIFAGFQEADSGKIFINGQERLFRQPSDALQQGIGMVRQSPQLIPSLNLLEHCVLGNERCLFFGHKMREQRKRFNELSCRYGFNLNPDQKGSQTHQSERQKAAILSLLFRDISCLIMDEPSASLAPEETQHLFELIERLKADGLCIILITHKISEAVSKADYISVLRSGNLLISDRAQSIAPNELSTYIFGMATESSTDFTTSSSGYLNNDSMLLTLKNIQCKDPRYPRLHSVNLYVHASEILGIAGIKESGLESLELLLGGWIPASAGSMELKGKPINDLHSPSIRKRRYAGIQWLPADRTRRSCALQLNLSENMLIHSIKRFQEGILGFLGFPCQRKATKWTESLTVQAGIQGHPQQRADSLSGGNLQKLIIQRELSEKASVYLLAKPTQSLDGRGKCEFLEQLEELRGTGAGIILISDDPDELIRYCDRIQVLHDGELSPSITKAQGESQLHNEIINRMSIRMTCPDA